MSEKIPPEPQNIPKNIQKDIPLKLLEAQASQGEDPGRHQADAAAHLANERTFMLWSFAALFIMSGGVAMARTLIAINTSPFWLGAEGPVLSLFYPTTMGLIFLAAGMVIIVLAAFRYLCVQTKIMKGCYQPSATPVLVYLAIILCLGVLLVGFLLQLRGAFGLTHAE